LAKDKPGGITPAWLLGDKTGDWPGNHNINCAQRPREELIPNFRKLTNILEHLTAITKEPFFSELRMGPQRPATIEEKSRKMPRQCVSNHQIRQDCRRTGSDIKLTATSSFISPKNLRKEFLIGT
jgi:hypothetical protein